MAGGWQLIGYMAPNDGNTTNFAYTGPGIEKDQSSDLSGGNIVGWQAHNNTNLNECAIGDNWTVKLNKETSTTKGDDIKFDASAGNAGCVALTPTFDKIGK